MPSRQSIFHQLMAVLEDRNVRRPAGSYTTTLLDGGVDAITKKIAEESRELIEAAKMSGDKTERQRATVHEAADLLYHLFVLLVHDEVTLQDVEAELQRRFGTSGLEEKRRRGNGTG